MSKDILITGYQGFIGKNLVSRLKEDGHKLFLFGKQNSIMQLHEFINQADFIYHLAGENRSADPLDFTNNNENLTCELVTAVLASQQKQSRNIPIMYSSSIHAGSPSYYGESKRRAEDLLLHNDIKSIIYRLPGIFGKWSKPDYNSVIATYCYNISRDLPIKLSNPSHILKLEYIDNLIEHFISLLTHEFQNSQILEYPAAYEISLLDLERTIRCFHDSRITQKLSVPLVGLNKYLYSTFLYFAPHLSYCKPVQKHEDSRGVFAELLKFKEFGQISIFTAEPQIERGLHYHHSKNEKFFVVRGEALFTMTSLETGEILTYSLNSTDLSVVESIPGWAHKIKNIGSETLVVVLWANESFNKESPDTFYHSFAN